MVLVWRRYVTLKLIAYVLDVFDQVVSQVKDSLAKGATATVGGHVHHELNAAGGFFHHPTVLTGVTKEMLPYRQETFGPILPLIKFKTEAEVIEMANDTEYVMYY